MSETELWDRLDRPRLAVKVPGGLEAGRRRPQKVAEAGCGAVTTPPEGCQRRPAPGLLL